MACCTRAAKNGAIGVQRRRCRWTRPRGMRRCTPGATNSATAVQPPLPAPVRLGFLAGDGFELLVEPHPAAGLDQATGGHGGGQHGPGRVGHPGGGEPGRLWRPRWRLRRLGNDKGLVLPRWCGGGLGRRSGRGAAPALFSGDAQEPGGADVVAATDRLGVGAGQIFGLCGGEIAGALRRATAWGGRRADSAHAAIVRRPGAGG